MFHYLGRLVTLRWPIVLLGWLLLWMASRHFAPSWNQVAQDKEFAFLPARMPSRIGEAEFKKAFPDDPLGSSIVLVLEMEQGGKAALDRGKKFIDHDLEPGLRKIAIEEGGLASEAPAEDEPLFSDAPEPARKNAPRSIMSRIRTPNAPGAGALLESQDGKALIVVVELTTEFLSKDNWPTIARIEELVQTLRVERKIPADTDLFLTGSAVLGRDYIQAELYSARATESLTLILVLTLLIVIYRSPLMALIPLLTVFVTIQVSLNLLAILAEYHYVTLFQGIQIYITVLVYGAGVDYCLFLVSRYREEADRGAGMGPALTSAVGQVGAALAASAATVMCGIGMMVFAEFGKFHYAGVVIPISIFIALCTVLTFSTVLLRLSGRWAFWPYAARPTPQSQPSKGGFFDRRWRMLGYLILHRPGAVWLGFVAALAPFAVFGALFAGEPAYDPITNLPGDDPGVVGVNVLQKHFSPGTLGPVTFLLVNPHADFSSKEGRNMIETLTDRLRTHQEELRLTDIRALTEPLGITSQAQRGIAALNLPAKTRDQLMRSDAQNHYTTDFGKRNDIGTRLEFVFDCNPLSHQSIAYLDRLEKTVTASLPAGLHDGTEIYVVGPTASIRDLSLVRNNDHLRIMVLVLAGVFVILVLLLRQPLVSIYLLVSVLFSYYATLGGTYLLFWALDPHHFAGLDWKVSTFLFTILIAVGEDYNIFLITRVREEQGRHGPRRGIARALIHTGPIISSCGVIMAGTFASLLSGNLSEMKQLGFALAFGVLLDTFVVRPALVPAFLVMVEKIRRARAVEPTVNQIRESNPEPSVRSDQHSRQTR